MKIRNTDMCISPARHGERGAISIMAAVGLTATLIVAALAVDIGRLAFEERRLQLVADMAALDAARCAGGGMDNDAAVVQAAAQASAIRNNFLLTDLNNTLPIALGMVSTDANSLRQFAAAGLATPNAVQVTANRTIPLSLMAGGLFPATTGTAALTEVAVARGEPRVGIRVGSFLLNVNTEQATLLNNILGGLLGGAVNLSAASYQGIIDSSVTLGELVAASVSVGTVEELLSTNMSIADFLQLAATALQNQGTDDATQAAVTLGTLATAAAALGPVGLTVGDLIAVTTENPEAAADAAVNVFDLVMLGAQVAREDAAVAVPVGINIPGVATATLTISVIEPPQIAVGPPGVDADGDWLTEVRTAQVRVQLDVRALQALNLVLGLLLPSINNAPVNLNLYVDVAQTTARVKSFDCVTGAVTVEAQPGVAEIGIGRFQDITDPNPDPVINPSQVVNVLNLLQVTAGAQVPLEPDAQDLEFTGPFPAETQTVGTELGEAVDNALAGLLNTLDLDIQLLGLLLPLDAVLEPVVEAALLPILQPILPVLDTVLVPLFQALGVTVGGADVTVTSVTTERQLVR